MLFTKRIAKILTLLITLQTSLFAMEKPSSLIEKAPVKQQLNQEEIIFNMLKQALDNNDPKTFKNLLERFYTKNKESLDLIMSRLFNVVYNTPKYKAFIPIINQFMYSKAPELHRAIFNNDIEVVKKIITKNPHLINVPDEWNKTPLGLAIDYKNSALIELLLKNGANPNMMSQRVTPLDQAIEQESIPAIEILLKYGADANSVNEGISPLLTAITNDNIDILKILLKRGADPNKVIEGFSPLMFAVAQNKLDMIEMLLNHGADVNKVVFDEASPFTATIMLGSKPKTNKNKLLQLVKLFIAKGVNVNQKNMYGFTPLHYAVLYDAPIARALLAAHANPNEQDNSGLTPLHFAVQFCKEDLVRLLLKHNADPAIKSRENMSAYDYAEKSKCKNMLQVALKAEQEDPARRAESFLPTQQKKAMQPQKGVKKTKKTSKSKKTFAQRQEQKQLCPPQQEVLDEAVEVEETSLKKEEPLDITLAGRVLDWLDDAWVAKEENRLKKNKDFEYWHFMRSRLYHRLPPEAIKFIIEHGNQIKRPNETYPDQMDTKWELRGEMQFFDPVDNAWKPGKQRQPGYYHVTQGSDGIIYHIGFDPIEEQSLTLLDFMPQAEIIWDNEKGVDFVAFYNKKDQVRHQFLLR